MCVTHHYRTSLLAVTIALTQFLLNPLNQVNQANPRFLGFTCRMKPLFEYSGYHSGHFASITGISIKILGSSEYWEHQGSLSTSPLFLDHVCQIVIIHDSWKYICLCHFSVKYYLSFLHYYQDTRDFGLAKPTIDNTSEQTLLPPSMSQYLHYIEECQTS